MIWLPDVQPLTGPHWSTFGDIWPNGLLTPRRLSSPKLSSDGFNHASGASSSESSRTPCPAYKRTASVPASQNDMPLGAVTTPATRLVASAPDRPFTAA